MKQILLLLCMSVYSMPHALQKKGDSINPGSETLVHGVRIAVSGDGKTCVASNTSKAYKSVVIVNFQKAYRIRDGYMLLDTNIHTHPPHPDKVIDLAPHESDRLEFCEHTLGIKICTDDVCMPLVPLWHATVQYGCVISTEETGNFPSLFLFVLIFSIHFDMLFV